jgi:hypothetical protein
MLAAAKKISMITRKILVPYLIEGDSINTTINYPQSRAPPSVESKENMEPEHTGGTQAGEPSGGSRRPTGDHQPQNNPTVIPEFAASLQKVSVTMAHQNVFLGRLLCRFVLEGTE